MALACLLFRETEDSVSYVILVKIKKGFDERKSECPNFTQ